MHLWAFPVDISFDRVWTTQQSISLDKRDYCGAVRLLVVFFDPWDHLICSWKCLLHTQGRDEHLVSHGAWSGKDAIKAVCVLVHSSKQSKSHSSQELCLPVLEDCSCLVDLSSTALPLPLMWVVQLFLSLIRDHPSATASFLHRDILESRQIHCP